VGAVGIADSTDENLGAGESEAPEDDMEVEVNR
jgi:hypothetical protein